MSLDSSYYCTGAVTQGVEQLKNLMVVQTINSGKTAGLTAGVDVATKDARRTTMVVATHRLWETSSRNLEFYLRTSRQFLGRIARVTCAGGYLDSRCVGRKRCIDIPLEGKARRSGVVWSFHVDLPVYELFSIK